MTKHEEYQNIIRERYGTEQYFSYEQKGYYDWVMFAPEQYLTEELMLEYVKKYPNATLKEVFRYFEQVTPEGLAPGDAGEDL